MSEASGADVLEESWNIQADASALGFDWPDITGVLDKIAEELAEIRDAVGRGDMQEAGCELGDLLLATVNAARFIGIQPSDALSAANDRFSRRFALVKEQASRAGLCMRSCSLDQLDALWHEAKVRARHTLENTP